MNNKGDNVCAVAGKNAFKAFPDRFDTLESISKAIKNAGVEKCGLIFGIDYTLSNNMQGKHTFDGFSLHHIAANKINPYQEVICIMGETLESLDDDGIIPAYGFGDRVVKDKRVFLLKANGHCQGFSDVLDVYNRVTPTINLGGPTSFAPLINEAVKIVQTTKQYHILIIVTDGITSVGDTVEAIVHASNYPLSIVVIGVGDGPWDAMVEFDDHLPARNFDNFQFVDFHTTKSTAKKPQAAVALAALMEIPDQYKAIKDLCLI